MAYITTYYALPQNIHLNTLPPSRLRLARTQTLQILILEPFSIPQKDLLNKSNVLNTASILSAEVTFISLATALSLSKRIYKRLILAAVYYTNPLVTVPNLYLVLAPHLASTTYGDKVITNILQEPLPTYHQKVYPRVKSLSRIAILQDLVECIKYCKP